MFRSLGMYVMFSLLVTLASLVSADSHGSEKELIDIQISAGEWPPFLGKSLPNQGLVAQLIRDVFEDAGFNVEFVFLPWLRAYKEASIGKQAATGVWMFKEDRTDDFHYSDPVLSEQFVLFYLINERAFDWSDISELSGKKIGGGLGYSYGPAFDQAAENGAFELLRQPTTEQNIRMLAAGRTELFIEERSVAMHTLNNATPELAELITFHPKPVLVNQSFLLFPKGSPSSEALMSIFNKHLEAFKQDGRYQMYFESSD